MIHSRCMISYDFSNIWAAQVGPNHGITPEECEDIRSQVLAAHQKVEEEQRQKTAPLWDLPESAESLKAVSEISHRIKNQFENLLVIGIGGSSIGLKCLLGALLPPLYNLKGTTSRAGFPRIFVLEAPSPETLVDLMETLEIRKTCINLVSKSGRTVETLAIWFCIQEILKKEVGRRWREHVVVITGEGRGTQIKNPLAELAEEEDLVTLTIPENLPGRFSVFSPVGLFGATCVGIDAAALLKGARESIKSLSNDDFESNPTLFNAVVHYFLCAKKGKGTSVMMPYGDSLKEFGNWYSQLFAESLGKTSQAPTPLPCLGPQDQHSLLQLFQEGPKDKIVTFIEVDRFPMEKRIPKQVGEFSYLSHQGLEAILKAELRATGKSLAEVGCPSVTVTMDQLDAFHIGQLLMSYMIQTVLTAALMNVNPYDQPGVDRSKELTRALLSKK